MTPLTTARRRHFFPVPALRGSCGAPPSCGRCCWPWSLALLPALNGCFGDDQKTSGLPAAPVRTAAVVRADVPRLLHVVGNVRASASVGVRPRVAGEIQQVHFLQKGRMCGKGNPLSPSTPPFEAILREKRGMLAKSQAQLNKALDDMARYGKLVGGGYVSREAYEQTATQGCSAARHGAVRQGCRGKRGP